eukprot:jgi/Chrpa1/14336/Chrysochromulina_OHIO_Genome00017133-RA
MMQSTHSIRKAEPLTGAITMRQPLHSEICVCSVASSTYRALCSQHSASTLTPAPQRDSSECGGLRYVSCTFGAYSIFLRGRARCPQKWNESISSASGLSPVLGGSPDASGAVLGGGPGAAGAGGTDAGAALLGGRASFVCSASVMPRARRRRSSMSDVATLVFGVSLSPPNAADGTSAGSAGLAAADGGGRGGLPLVDEGGSGSFLPAIATPVGSVFS